MIVVHFVNVGQGNMQVIIFPDNFVMVYDCNITEENEKDVFNYLEKIMPKNIIDLFVNSHRDADHLRGIKTIHNKYPISSIWDTGISANVESPEYRQYMELRRELGEDNVHIVKSNQYLKSKPYVRILNGARDGLDNPNAQSIVLHIDHNGSSVLLTGDTDAPAWKDYIVPYQGNKIKSTVLLAGHHGSRSFIDHESYTHYYVDHLKKINPDFTIISVGNNPHGHPDDQAVKYYEKYTSGSKTGNKIFTTQDRGNIMLELKGNGEWSINPDQ